MPKFAANLSMLFTDLPFLDRFAAASEAGFKAVEFLFPYESPVESVAAKVQEAGLHVALFNMPPGNWSAGERGIASHPGREQEFREGVDKALSYAGPLKVKKLHAMAGLVPQGADRDMCRDTLVQNLKFAAARLAEHGITLVLEAINTRDMPGYSVTTQQESFEICQAVNAPNFKMQMDLYHMQVMEGDIATKLKRYASHCGHIQIAGCPERNEPDTGEVRYEYLFRVIDAIGYDGWIGCEYRPAGKTAEGLGWIRPYMPANPQ